VLPFPETPTAGDPRLSFAERYGTHEARASRVLDAAEAMVAERLLLREDVDRLAAALRQSRDVMAVL
jgi:hypothetical protein